MALPPMLVLPADVDGAGGGVCWWWESTEAAHLRTVQLATHVTC